MIYWDRLYYDISYFFLLRSIMILWIDLVLFCCVLDYSLDDEREEVVEETRRKKIKYKKYDRRKSFFKVNVEEKDFVGVNE